MQIQEHKKIYIPDEEIFSFQDTLLDDISFKVFVQCSKEKFLQYQKDILEEFVADFTNIIKTSEELDAIDIREIFEQHLQLLNTKLKQFAEKVRDVEHFSLKWIIQLTIDDKLMSSMIGNVSMMVLRDQKATYSVSNSVDTRAKIDLFSDFIEGNIERDDQILYIWLKFSDIMDAHDFKEMENLLAQEETSEWVLSFMEELFQTRIEQSSIWFIISYFIQWHTVKISSSNKSWLKLKWVKWKWAKYISELWNKVHKSERFQNLKEQISENKIYVIWAMLVILIFIFMYSLASQILNNNHSNKFQTWSWTYQEINLDDLQADISEFKTLDSSSNLKISAYKDISSKLDFLESEWKRLEDVAALRTQLDDNFYDWFNVRQFKSENELNNIAWKNTQVLTLNPTELNKLWDLHTIVVPKNNIMIAWSKWSIIDATSDTNRWTLIDTSEQSLINCVSSLNSNWLYCYNNAWWIYMISKAWIVPVWTEDWDFRSWIWWLWTYGVLLWFLRRSNLCQGFNNRSVKRCYWVVHK